MSNSDHKDQRQRAAPPPNFTQSPNIFYDVWLPKINSLAELKVIEVTIRQTFGWHVAESDGLTLDDLERLTGLTRPSVIEGVKRAGPDGHDIIERVPDGRSFRYRLKMRAELKVAAHDRKGKEFLLSDNSDSKNSLPSTVKNLNCLTVKNLYSDPNKDQKETSKDTHTPRGPLEPPLILPGVGVVVSRYTREQVKEYAAAQPKPLGKGWVVVALRTGDYDDDVREFFEEREQRERAKTSSPSQASYAPRAVKPPDPECPVCFGAGTHAGTACPCTFCDGCGGTGTEIVAGKGARACKCRDMGHAASA